MPEKTMPPQPRRTQRAWGQESRPLCPRKVESIGQSSAKPPIAPTAPNVPTDRKQLPNWDENGQPKCFNCQQYGHQRLECTEPKTCLISLQCGKNDQFSFDVYPSEINGKKADNILIDACCTLSQVHPKWLPRSYARAGTRWLKGANSTRRYPCTKVAMRVQGRTFKTLVAVREDLEYDAILGLDVRYLRALLRKEPRWPANRKSTKPEAREVEQEDSDSDASPTRSTSSRSSDSSNCSDGSVSSNEGRNRRNVNRRRRRRKQPSRQCAPRQSYVPALSDGEVERALGSSDEETELDEIPAWAAEEVDEKRSSMADDTDEPQTPVESDGRSREDVEDLPQFSESIFQEYSTRV